MDLLSTLVVVLGLMKVIASAGTGIVTCATVVASDATKAVVIAGIVSTTTIAVGSSSSTAQTDIITTIIVAVAVLQLKLDIPNIPNI